MPLLQGLSQMGEGAGRSFTGMASKAIIEIEDERIHPEEVTVTESRARGAGGLVATVSGGLAQGLSAVASPSGISDAIRGLAKDAGQLLPSAKKQFVVRFNPSQISFQAQGGGKVAKTNFVAGDPVKMEYEDMKPRIQMNVQLVFDDYERTDAFQFEKFSDGMAMIRTVADSAVTAAQKKPHSVKPQVEGFIGALRNNKTRKITFYWGNMAYQGVLNQLSAEYTMFSSAGHPIRANVNLGILCVDESMGDNNMGQWKTSFQKAFVTEDRTKLESAMQNVGNLLNINT